MKNLNSELRKIKEIGYDNCSLLMSDLVIEAESIAYKACSFKLNELDIICRKAKITPKKIGQFVTFWKRNADNITEPFDETTQIDFYVINVMKDNRLGQFVFPKSILIKKKIMSAAGKDGKRGFRVYPIWDIPNNKQAKKTKDWQTKYFIEFDSNIDFNLLSRLYQHS